MSARRVAMPDLDAASAVCADHVLGVLDGALSRAPFATFAVSGGGTAKFLFEKLASAKLPWDRLHLFWVDERCVPPHDPASNFGAAERDLIQPAGIPASHVHRIRGEIKPHDAAVEYEQEIRDFFGIAAGDFPRFDLMYRGMGPDAHTASLFPGDPIIDDHERIAAATYVKKFDQWRVTLLPGALLAAADTVFLVAGLDKREAVYSVFNEDYDPMRYPAQIGLDKSTWFLDTLAAG